MESSLRQRVRKVKINCIPWRVWKGEIELLPISGKTLFSKRGLPIDILERELREEGWLFQGEVLLEALKTELNRKHLSEVCEVKHNFGLVPEDFDEEDYLLLGKDLNCVPF